MKKILIPLTFLTFGAIVGALPLVAQAQTFEQRQELRNEFTVECSWSSTDASQNNKDSQPCKVTGTQNARQEQLSGDGTSTISTEPSRSWSMSSSWHDDWDDSVTGTPIPQGKVKLRWNYDDGVCHIRYSEATVRAYKYTTSTDCDNGGIEIGGLMPSKAYRFQIRDQDTGWSSARRLVAR